MKENLLKFIGNDSGFGDKNNSAYFEQNNELFIIDCGFTIFNEIKNKLENLTFIKTKHTDYLDAYGFVMNINNKRILYTGDTCEIESFSPYLNNINELYIDLSKFGGAHLKVDDVLGTLKDLKNKDVKIIPMHIDDKEYVLTLISKL